MIIVPVGDYKDRLHNLSEQEPIINALVTRLNDSLTLLEGLNVDWKEQEKNFLQFTFNCGKSKGCKDVLQFLITRKKLFVMLYDSA